MTLTKDDLQAIKDIVDDAVEDAKLQTAAGFAEVHEKFNRVDQRFKKIDQRFEKIDEKFEKIDARFEKIEKKVDRLADNLQKVKQTVNRIEDVQAAEVTRLDEQGKEIRIIKRKLKLA
jgi:archaellum component FlaC